MNVRMMTYGAVAALLLGATITACSSDGTTSDDFESTTSFGAGGSSFASTGSNMGTGPTGTTSGAGAGNVAPPELPPEEQEPEKTCEELDPTKNAVLYLSADDSNSMASPAFLGY